MPDPETPTRDATSPVPASTVLSIACSATLAMTGLGCMAAAILSV